MSDTRERGCHHAILCILPILLESEFWARYFPSLYLVALRRLVTKYNAEFHDRTIRFPNSIEDISREDLELMAREMRSL